GLIGLTRAFLRAGVPRVVSSLWQVEDNTTAALIARLYRALLLDRMTPPAALRRSQPDASVETGAGARAGAGFAFHGAWRARDRHRAGRVDRPRRRRGARRGGRALPPVRTAHPAVRAASPVHGRRRERPRPDRAPRRARGGTRRAA